MTTLTHSLGDKLQQVVEPEKSTPKHRAGPRHNPRSGIDIPDCSSLMEDGAIEQLRVSLTVTDPDGTVHHAQKTWESRDKNDEEAGTASKNTNHKHIRMETHMNQTTSNENITSNGQPTTHTPAPQNQGQEQSFDKRAMNVAESATRSLEKVANDGITIKPTFKRRRAEGFAVAGAAVGLAGGAVLGTVLMGKFGNNPSNQDITHAGYAAALVGGVAGACTGSAIGGWLDDRAVDKATEKKTEK